MTKLLTRSQFAKLAGVNASTVTRVSKTVLAAACSGQRIDSAHPDAVEYLAKQDRAKQPEIATGVDSQYENAIKFCQEKGRYSTSSIQREFKIGYNRAKRILETMRTNGLVPEGCSPTTGKAPAQEVPTFTAEEFQQRIDEFNSAAPKLRGNAAANQTKKNFALQEAAARQEADINARQMHEVPDNIVAFADMTLRELIERYGTDTAFVDWLKATKAIEDINTKRLDNAKKAGELVSRMIVKTGIIDTIDGAFTRMLTDGAKTIAVRATTLIQTGGDATALEELVAKQLGTFIRPTKSKITRVLRNA